MKNLILHKSFLAFLLATAAFVAACGSGAEGKYRDPSGSINAEFKDGKPTLVSVPTPSTARTKSKATRLSPRAISA
jgi:hypothetical protein